MTNKILLTAILLVACGAILFFWPSDEKKIRGKLASLAEYCSTEQQEPVLETMKKATLAAKLCTEPCSVRVESLKIDRGFSEKELADRILMMKKRLPDTEFKFHDIMINIAGGERAEITTTLRIVGTIVDEQITDAYEIDITAEKIDGEWLFSSFTVVEFMKR